MELIRPESLEEALRIKRATPEALPVHGGTDVLVELNFRRRRPAVVLDLTAVPELRGWTSEGGTLRIGAAVTYTQAVDQLGGRFPSLAAASRTVGSLQIRNRGTIAGNLGTASPAGDALPPLVAVRADVEAASADGARTIPIDEFFVGPKQNALRDDELIVAVRVAAAPRVEQFAKVGARNAMVIAVCSLALAVDPATRRVGVGIGAAGPTPLRSPAAERFLEAALEEGGAWSAPATVAPTAAAGFAALVADAAQPIDDVRGSARYRRHATAVLAKRALARLGESANGSDSGR